MKRIYRIFRRLIKLFIFTVIFPICYIYEMAVSIFDDSVRICFTNFWPNFKQEHVSSLLKVTKDNCEDISPNKKKRVKLQIVKFYNPQIHYFSVYGNIEKLRKSKSLVKILYNGENVEFDPWVKYKGNCIDCVDLSLGFNYMEADNYIRFPNWFRRDFLHCDSKDEIKEIFNIANNVKRQYRKIKFCSLISSLDVNGLRTEIYNNISKIDNVDCPGKLLHNDDTLHNKYNNDKRMYLQQYKFNICPENSIGEGYCTEKLFDCLFSGCIPIYNGWSKNPEPGIINPNIILWYDHADEENNKYTLKEIKKMHENDNLYRLFVEQPFFCDTAVDKIFDMLIRFNEKMREILTTSKII